MTVSHRPRLPWRRLTLIPVLLGAVVLAACSTLPPPSPTSLPSSTTTTGGSETLPSLYNTWVGLSWTDANSETSLSDFNLTLSDDGILSGRAGCNHFSGSLTLGPGDDFVTLSAADVVSTDMACGGTGVMDRESRFFELLTGEGFRLYPAGDTLTMAAADVSIELALDPTSSDSGTDLPGGAEDPDAPVTSEWDNPWFDSSAAGGWLLVEMTSGDTTSRPAAEVLLEVDPTGFGGRICNHFGATVADIDPDPADADDSNPWPPDIFRTLMACADDEITALEEVFLDALSVVTEVEVSAMEMVLSGEDVSLRFVRPAKPADPASPGDGSAPSDTPPDLRLTELTRVAIAALAEEITVSTADISLVSAEPQVWPDSALGCPQPGQGYTTALVDGYRIVLEARGETYHYHGSWTSQPFLCQSPDTP